MSARKILPIATPDLTSYAHLAYHLSILYTDKDALRWVYANFIQLYVKDDVMVDYYTQNPDCSLVPSIGGSPRMTKNLIRRFSPSFTDFVRQCIDEGYYLSTFVDEFYIPGTVAYRNRSNNHGIFIYGYDDGSRMFHVSAFLSNQSYGDTLVSYEDMEQGFQGIEPRPFHYTFYTHLYKLNELYKPFFGFYAPWVMEQMDDYLHAKPSDRRMRAFEETKTPSFIWGMDIYDWMRNKIERQMARETMIDHRPFYVLWEHKRMMNRRLAYMETNDFYVCSTEVLEGYRKVEQAALLIRNLKLKFLMSFDNRYLEQLIARLGALKAEESLVVERMLEEYETSLRLGDENARRLQNAL
ncbi:hypothetical protein ACFPPD_09720 [Cohnella suwonensis]|uniref:Butirosin biosynthesis protein H N-terminal domain-containing protein n=1 Tax=Cohnella suwonensis TaxID=696072 RepID=A0ABW0LUP4_9BACL